MRGSGSLQQQPRLYVHACGDVMFYCSPGACCTPAQSHALVAGIALAAAAPSMALHRHPSISNTVQRSCSCIQLKYQLLQLVWGFLRLAQVGAAADEVPTASA